MKLEALLLCRCMNANNDSIAAKFGHCMSLLYSVQLVDSSKLL